VPQNGPIALKRLLEQRRDAARRSSRLVGWMLGFGEECNYESSEVEGERSQLVVWMMGGRRVAGSIVIVLAGFLVGRGKTC